MHVRKLRLRQVAEARFVSSREGKEDVMRSEHTSRTPGTASNPRMHPRPALWSFLAITALSLSGLQAQSEEQSGDPDESAVPPVVETVVVTANRDAVPLSEVGSSVTVIGLEEIEQRNQLYVSDLLRTVTGVEITQTGGAGKLSSVRLRGGTASQALVLVDGIRINTATGGSVDLSNLTADGIESIEVLRGPQATYGSEAMTGVISITTRRGEPGLKWQVAGEAGSREHERVDGAISGGNDSLDFSLFASDLSTDTVSQLSLGGEAEESDPYENTTYGGRFGWRFLDDGRLDLVVRETDGTTALDGFGVEDPNAEATTEVSNVALSFEKSFLPRWRQTLRVGETTTDLFGEDPDTFFNNYTILSETFVVDAQADVELADNYTLNIGFSHEERDGESIDSYAADAELDSWFVQNQWSPNDQVHLTAAVRQDDHSVFGDETSYRFTGVVALSEGRSSVHGSWGSAFRAPNFVELFFPFSGDPNLLPETSEGWDVGYRHSFADGRFALDVTVFDIEFENLINFDLSTFLFGNIASAKSSGVELVARYRQGPSFAMTLAHTYNDTEDDATGEPLARRPEHRTSLVARFAPVDRFEGAAMLMSVNDRIDSTGLPMDDYNRIDLSLGYQVLDWLRPYVRVQNLFDEDYEEVPGFTSAGSTFMLGVRLMSK